MRCYICNKILEPKEIQFDKDNHIKCCKICEYSSIPPITFQDLFLELEKEENEIEKKLKEEISNSS